MNDLNASPQNVPLYTSKFVAPPPPNLKMTIGEDTYYFVQFYSQKPPNRFQRWLTHKLLGIKLEILK